MGSPTQRSLAHCKKMGWLAGIVERWLPVPSHPAGGVRKDLFGFIDLIVLDGKGGTLGVQATSSSNLSARWHKIQQSCFSAADRWLREGNRIEVWGWAKRCYKLKSGKRSTTKRWGVRKVRILDRSGDLVITDRVEEPSWQDMPF